MTATITTTKRVLPALGQKRPLVSSEQIKEGLYSVPRYTVTLCREPSAQKDAYACIHAPSDVYNIVEPMLRDRPTEALIALYLDSKNRVIGVQVVSVGILDSSLVHPREVFQGALLHNAACVILSHNHPSGDPTPSVEDKRVTQRLYEAGEILGVDLLDHVVIGDGKWISLKQIGAF